MQNSEDSLVESESDAVPWTIQQTWYGIILTLIPWAILAVGLSQLGQSKASQNTPLSFQANLMSAIIVFIFSCVIEGVSHCATLYCQQGISLNYSSLPPGFESTWLQRFRCGEITGTGSHLIYSHLCHRYSLSIRDHCTTPEPANQRPGPAPAQ